MCPAAKSLNPKIKIIAARAPGGEQQADAHKSKAAGALQVDAVKPKTLADGLQAKMGNLTWVSLSLSLSVRSIGFLGTSDNLLCLPLSASSGNFVIATLFEKAVVRDLVDDVVVVEEARS